MNKLEIYTDGAYSASRKSGGWSFIIVKNGERIHSAFGKVVGTTINRMEVFAACEALNWMRENNYTNAPLTSDSKYLVSTMKGEYQRKTNLPFWSLIDKLNEGLNIEWIHIRGHQGNKWNEMCDLLCVTGSQME